MDWSKIVLALILPVLVWLLTFGIFAVQMAFLVVFETRIASGIIDKKYFDYVLAAVIAGLASHYDQHFAAPLLSSLYPQFPEEEVRGVVLFFIGGFSALHAGVAFHYSLLHVTRFSGRSMLVFQQQVYEKDPRTVRLLWIRILNLIGLTSVALIALAHVYIYTAVRGLNNLDSPLVVAYTAGLVAAGFATIQMRKLILHFPSTLVLVAKLNQIMAQNAKPREQQRSLSPRKSDQIGWARRELLHVSRMLERLARQEDAVSGPDVQHPIAAIYRAVADEIRLYCRSPKSLDGPLPGSLVTTLRATQGFIITGDATWRRHIVRRLSVFDEHGKPRPLSTTSAERSTIRFVRVSGRLIDLSLAWIQQRWLAIAVVIAAVAVILGGLDIETLIGLAA
ncbi:hypothetical protein [Verrucosispora sp. FIM060022]|uniref:hypothetical protein n=1 Tax=Verrucosispora sp. FIM060022 TaxID=1479020 RepID=UPI000F8734CB|nr:hypothetical protein [Verrucosispora sp. FIM060022]RUL90964.1 hypothetical protein EG812_22205 [Verrucosispora sp. FIM060022]